MLSYIFKKLLNVKLEKMFCTTFKDMLRTKFKDMYYTFCIFFKQVHFTVYTLCIILSVHSSPQHGGLGFLDKHPRTNQQY